MTTRLIATQPTPSARNVPMAVVPQHVARDAVQDWQAETLTDQAAVDQ